VFAINFSFYIFDFENFTLDFEKQLKEKSFRQIEEERYAR